MSHAEHGCSLLAYFRRVAVEWYAEAKRLNDDLLYFKAIDGEEWKFK